jgi:hypothetical protein
MNVAAAKAAADAIAGRIAEGHVEPGRRAGVKLADAWKDYLAHLDRLAERRGKPARWRRNVEQLGRLIVLRSACGAHGVRARRRCRSCWGCTLYRQLGQRPTAP